MNHGGGGGGGYTDSRSPLLETATGTEARRVFRTEITDAASFALARYSDQTFWIEKTHNIFANDESLKSHTVLGNQYSIIVHNYK